MTPFEETDLKIIELETEDDTVARLYLLIEVNPDEEFSTEKFVEELDKVLPIMDKNPNAFDNMLDKMSVIEIFDQEDVEELIDQGIVDPDDLHSSLYEFLLTENDDAFDDEE